jgi:hypothetical protein
MLWEVVGPGYLLKKSVAGIQCEVFAAVIKEHNVSGVYLKKKSGCQIVHYLNIKKNILKIISC